jgi:metacaspase-1
MESYECCVCPVDFDFSPQHAITASNFMDIFASIPPGVVFQFVSDSCHSGDLARELLCKSCCSMPYRVPRQFPMPADIAWRRTTAISLGMDSLQLERALPAHLHGALISGCRSNQTSADAYLEGKYCGALSAMLLKRLRSNDLAVSLTQLVVNVNDELRKANFEQEPQLRGDPAHLASHWLQGD